MRAIPLEEVVRLPAPGGGGPNHFRFHGSRTLLFLQPAPGSLANDLWSLDLETGERTKRIAADRGAVEGGLSLEEQLRRERLRLRAVGVTSYRTAGSGRSLAVPLGGELWIERVSEGLALGEGLRRLEGESLDPALSPDGRRVAFVREAELHVADLETGETRQLTSGARGTGRTHGLAEFVAQEEMKRPTGFWWSSDGTQLAYTEVDETHIPVWRIPYEGKAVPSWEDHRYPFAGAENARVSLFVVATAGGDPVRMDLGTGVEYLARVAWMPDGRLVAQVQDRLQRRLAVRVLDPGTGRGEEILVEESPVFVELHDLFRPLADGGFLWGSERSGFLHLYVVSREGEVRALTSGDWVVDELCAVDEGARRVWFLGSADGPLERHLYEVPLDGGPIRRLTEEPGTHSVVIDTVGKRLVDAWSTRSAPPTTVVRSLDDGGLLQVLHRPDDPRIAKLGLVPPELVTLKSRSGDVLYGHLHRPEGDGPYPTVVFVYGGPHVQRVTEAWDATVDLRAQHLRSRGVAVLKVDNRGSARRGAAFASALYGETGRVELEDQVDAVRQLAEQGLVDPAHVGITGWSYGGYMTLMAMFRAADVFRVGVAGAPVTHWDGYDTHYTERYMGLPTDNAAGYAASSVLPYVNGLDGHLMLVHGMLDENVHFRHTGRLVNELTAARKDFELRVFPDERHMPRKPADRLYMEERILRFLLQHL